MYKNVAEPGIVRIILYPLLFLTQSSDHRKAANVTSSHKIYHRYVQGSHHIHSVDLYNTWGEEERH